MRGPERVKAGNQAGRRGGRVNVGGPAAHIGAHPARMIDADRQTFGRQIARQVDAEIERGGSDTTAVAFAAAFGPVEPSRAVPVTSSPRARICAAICCPIPRFAPVMTTRISCSFLLA